MRGIVGFFGVAAQRSGYRRRQAGLIRGAAEITVSCLSRYRYTSTMPRTVPAGPQNSSLPSDCEAGAGRDATRLGPTVA